MSRSVPEPWIPETRPVVAAILGKLAEEAGELASAASRCFIHGIDQREPETGKLNREWLEDEIADVLANMCVAITTLGLNEDEIAARKEHKIHHLVAWHDMIDNDEEVE